MIINQKTKRVAVLMGGWSNERNVSMVSGRGVVTHLKELHYDVVPVDVTHHHDEWVQKIMGPHRPDVVFNALHGTGGEDGVIQGLLEALHIPYTHSGVFASAVGMDKIASKILFEKHAIPTPRWTTCLKKDFHGFEWSYPYVVKPVADGSSIGVHLVHEKEHKDHVHDETWHHDTTSVLVEEYIKGREIHVTLLGGEAVGTVEIKPLKRDFYDYDTKYTEGMAEHILPAPLTSFQEKTLFSYAEKAYKALRCRGVSRADFLYKNDEFYLLEMNTQPGLTPLSLIPETLKHARNMSYSDVLEWCLADASIGR
jgi:D-alanine-D-alanine ligase